MKLQDDFSAIEFSDEGEPFAYRIIESDDNDGYGDAAQLLMGCELLGDQELNLMRTYEKKREINSGSAYQCRILVTAWCLPDSSVAS